MFLWDNVRVTYQIQLIIVNIINPLWTPWHSVINIGLVSKLKKWQANGDYIAKVSIEGW